MFFTRGHPALRALIGAVLLIIGLLAHRTLLTAAGAVVLAWGIIASAAAWRGRGLIGGKGSGGKGSGGAL
jgi:hypothetical protein